MPISESPTVTLHGLYHDVLRDPRGDVIWDRGWNKNAIVKTCRSLLASFMAGTGPALGIDGVLLGAGLPSWDQDVGKPSPDTLPERTALFDANPYKFPKSELKIDFLDGGTVTTTPTNRIQIFAKLGPGVPSWPDGNHVTSNLREFGLVGTLGGNPVLLNYVMHPVITKDPASTLERTIWLVF